MKIHEINRNNFKGYDARPLKGLFMGSNTHNIAKEIQNIGYKEGFKVYSKQKVVTGKICSECIPDKIPPSNVELWAQDLWTFLKRKLLSNFNEEDNIIISKFFNIKKITDGFHISGGNFFIVDNNGSDEMFIGESVLKDANVEDIKKMFNVKKLFILPQMDYHLDLFMRPLDRKNILVADDEMTLRILEKGCDEFEYFIKEKKLENNPIATQIRNSFFEQIFRFRNMYNYNICPQVDKISEIICEAGYNPIRVPGRIYTTTYFDERNLFLSHDCNYINAVVLKNKDDEIVYITNKSNIDKVLGLENDIAKDFDFRFENEFRKSIENYVKPDKIYFIDGDNNFVSTQMLKEMQGGVHCVCAEIPFHE